MTFFSSPGDVEGAVLFDRDGTLVHDVPFNRDPARVAPVAGARRALARVREARLGAAVVSNQPVLGDGRATRDQVDAVNAAVEHHVGAFDAWFVCPHTSADGCSCRKPAPGLIVEARRFFGLPPDRVVVIGDIGSDVEAARAAGCYGILVPTPETERSEIASAEAVADDIEAAVEQAIAVLHREEAPR